MLAREVDMKLNNDLSNILLATIPFVLLYTITFKVNLKKESRHRQLISPIIAVLYSVLFYSMIKYINLSIVEVLNRVFNLSMDISENARIKEWIGRKPEAAATIISSIYIFIINTLIILGFLVIKIPIIIVLKRQSEKPSRIIDAVSGIFYEYNEKKMKTYVRRDCEQILAYIKGFFYSGVTVSLIILVISQIRRDAVVFAAPFYPAFGLLMIGEIVSFLDGMKLEDSREFDEDSLRDDKTEADFEAIKSELIDTYPKRILFSNSFKTPPSIYGGMSSGQGCDSEEGFNSRITEKYFSELAANDVEIISDYINITRKLICGDNVIVFDPFYKDMTHYIILPLMKNLMEHNKCLVLSGAWTSSVEIRNWVETSIAEFTNAPGLWKSVILDSPNLNFDVAVLDYRDLYNFSLLNAYDDDFKKVGFILVLSPSKVLSTAQIGLSILAQKCGNKKYSTIYCVLDKNCDGLVDTISHTFRSGFSSVVASRRPEGKIVQLAWKAEGTDLHGKIFKNIVKYLGLGTEIAAIALKHGIDKASWIGNQKFPLLDIHWIVGQYFNIISEYIGIPPSQVAVGLKISVNEDFWGSERAGKNFMIEEDEINNAFEMFRLFSTRARENGFMNLISEDYLLRDYMIDNFNIFMNDAKAIPNIVPDLVRSERNALMKVLMLSCGNPLEEEEVKKIFLINGFASSGKDILSQIELLTEKHCNIKDPGISTYFKDEINEDNISTVQKKYYYFDMNSRISEFSRTLSNCYFIAEDEDRSRHNITALLYDLIYQKVLPGQFVTYSGKYYQVQGMNDCNEIILRRASDHINKRTCYRQERRIKIVNIRLENSIGALREIDDIHMLGCFSDIIVSTEGYYEMESYSDLVNSRLVKINGIPPRIYHNKSMLKIRLLNSSPKILYTISLMLNEIFRSIYSYSHEYLAVTCKCPESIGRGLPGIVYSSEIEEEDENCLYIVEDSQIDLGLSVSVERNFDRFMSLILDYLRWCTEKEPDSDNSNNESLEEMISAEFNDENTKNNHVPEGKFRISKDYLKYGSDEFNEALDIENTIKYLEDHKYGQNLLSQTRINISNAIEDEEEPDLGQQRAISCDYCGKKLEDGHWETEYSKKKCSTCKEAAPLNNSGKKRLVKQVKSDMEKFFGMRIRKPVLLKLMPYDLLMDHMKKKSENVLEYWPGLISCSESRFFRTVVLAENGIHENMLKARLAAELSRHSSSGYRKGNREKSEAQTSWKQGLEPWAITKAIARWIEIEYLHLGGKSEIAIRLEHYSPMMNGPLEKAFKACSSAYPFTPSYNGVTMPFPE